MAAITAPALPAVPRPPIPWGLADALTIARRNLQTMRRTPQVIVISAIQPAIMMLVFRYVFGGSMRVPGQWSYVDFLIPGVFVQTIAFGAINTGIGLSEDLHTGLIERFRSLPMARSAVLAGRALSDLVRNLGVVLVVVGIAFLVGFRIHAGVPAFVGAIAVLLLFSFGFSWIFAFIGLRAPTAEAANAAMWPILAVLVFASTAFAPAENMPGWLQAYNDVQPVSVVVKAMRALCLGGPTATPVSHAVLWIAALVAVFAPLAVRGYRTVK